jgi:hypothetical protein
MATQTTAGILERFETVLQDPPCLLKPSNNPFTEATEPNISINETYRLQTGGLLSDLPVGNYFSARRERIIVTLYQRMDMDPYQAQRDLQDLLDTVERAIVADGTDHGYMADVEKGSRKATRPNKDSDLYEAQLSFMVDYDFDQGND